MHNPPQGTEDLGAPANSRTPFCSWSSMRETWPASSPIPGPHICDGSSAQKNLAFGVKAGVAVLESSGY